MSVHRVAVANWVRVVVLLSSAVGWTGCGQDNPLPPAGGAGGAGGTGGQSLDAGADASRDSAGDPVTDTGPDGDDGAGGNGSKDGSDVSPESDAPEGGAMNGPACGGCFADEVPAGARCIPNLSCGNPHHTVMTRSNGACQVQSCHAGWGDCDGRIDSGCETDITRPDNCNGCGVKCPSGQMCAATGCVTACPPPTTNCGGSCVDVSSSAEHCSDCFLPCRELQWHRPICKAGVCSDEMFCPAGAAVCANGCSLLDEDPLNCGMCGRRCDPPLGGTVSCRNRVCVPHCPTGLSWCDGACVDVEVDRANCGMCGRACATGGCVAGACDPSWTSVLASGTTPTALAVDDTSAYWLETGAGMVMKVPKSGGTAVPLATAQAAPFDLVLDASYVYWSNRQGNTIMRVAKGGGAPEVVVTATEPMHIATDGVSVFFEQPPPAMDAGALTAGSHREQGVLPVVRRVRIGTGTAEPFWEFPNGETDCTFGRLLVDDTNVYWAGRRRAIPGTFFLFLIEKESGATLRSFATEWGELTMDGAYLYSSNGSGTSGAPITVGSFGKIDGRGAGLMQFLPDGVYDGGGFMAADDKYLYRSSSGEFAGVQKFLKCGLQNVPVNLTGADRWSYLVADGHYVYGIFGAEIRRAHR